MKRKDKTKTCLSLFVAMMFILTSATVALGGNEASDVQSVPTIGVLDTNELAISPDFGHSIGTQGALATCTWPVIVDGINLLPNMPVGTYELCVDILQPDYSAGYTPVVDGALDGGYSLVVTDSTTEVICPPFFATTDDFYEILLGAPLPATGPWSISAPAYYGPGKEHSLEITQIDMAITAVVTMPFALGPADFVYLYRDYDLDASVDNAIGYNNGAWEYWTYDGAIWTGPAAIPGAYTYSLNGAMDEMTISFTTAHASSRFAARCVDDAPCGRPVGVKWYMFVPTATIDVTTNHKIEIDDCSDYMDVFNSLDLHPLNIYMAADCDFVYWFIQNNGVEPIGRTWIYIDFNLNGVYDAGEYIRLRPAISTTEVLDNTDTPIAGSELAGTCTEAVEFKIPRAVVIPPDDDCLCLGFPWTYRVTTIECGAACNVQNRGYTGSIGPTDWIDSCGITAIDCTEATVKAFIDIFQEDPLPYNDMICFDFEDVADIYNYWESVDGVSGDGSSPGGAIDTWAWSDARSHSPGHSMHCSQFDNYLGNQMDYLEGHIENTEGYTTITLDFWQWCEGEEHDGGLLQDYGWVQYSLDGGPWTDFGDVYWDNDTWANVIEEIPADCSGVTDIGVRFAWTSGPIIQNEGWYIDDVCFYGQESPMEFNIFQSHSLQEFTVTDGAIEYCFPKDWEATEGDYLIRVWMITEFDDCHEVGIPGTQADPFIFNVHVGDFVDAALTVNYYDGCSPFMMGDNLIVHGTVENTGTIDITDLPVTLIIKEQITDTILEDYIESGEGEWDEFSVTGSATPNPWHITDDASYSPTHSWTTNPYPAMGNAKVWKAINPLADDPLDFDFTAMVKYKLDADPAPATGVTFVFLAKTYYWDLSYDAGRVPTFPEGTSSSGWEYFSASDWLTSNLCYWEFIRDFDGLLDMLDFLNNRYGPPGMDIESYDACKFGFCHEATVAGGADSGFWFDNVKIVKIKEGAERLRQTQIVPELKAATPSDPADTVDVEFEWPDMPTGNFVEIKQIPDDGNNDNNMMSTILSVFTEITCVDLNDVEHYDLTEGIDSHWHIQTSGYNQYLWCGDDDLGTYDDDWDDVVMLAPDGDPSLDFTLSSIPDTFVLNFNDYAEIEAGWDWGWIEINPHVSDPGYQWYYSAYDTTGSYGWGPNSMVLTTADFFNPYTAADFATDIGSFTDDMGLRFRFVSDGSAHERGWLLDDIEIEEDIFELDPCDNMDNFLAGVLIGGDWWYYDGGYPGWICQDQASLLIPNDVNSALVWSASVPNALFAELTFDHEYDLENGYDYCYLEFSNNGGSSWTAPVGFTGIGAGTVNIDMTAFMGENVLIRWRVETDEAVPSGYYKLRSDTMCVSGQIDTVPPITIGTLSGTVIHGWYSSPVTFTATASDDVSGVGATYYKIDGGSALTYTGPITISVNGEHWIEYWSVDNVGNEETPHKETPHFMIDTGSAPSVSITAPTPGLYLFGNQILSMSKVFIIGGFTVQATASDADSGVYKVEFQLDGTTFGESTTAPYSAYCGLKHTGAGTITAIAEDFTGSTAQDTLAITYFKFL